MLLGMSAFQVAQCITSLKQLREFRLTVFNMIYSETGSVFIIFVGPCSVLKCCSSIILFLMILSVIIISIFTTKQYNSVTMSTRRPPLKLCPNRPLSPCNSPFHGQDRKCIVIHTDNISYHLLSNNVSHPLLFFSSLSLSVSLHRD